MTPHILTFDDASDRPDDLRALVLELPFGDVTSPVDGVTYPFIAEATPLIQMAVRSMLCRSLHGVPHINFCFARAMPEGVIAPHEIHHDKSMGQFSAHLYLNPAIWPGTGTQFWTHPYYGDRSSERDTPDYTQLTSSIIGLWMKTMFVTARFNRLLIHDSTLWHSAVPNKGFGKSQHDGRLVLTTFFDMES